MTRRRPAPPRPVPLALLAFGVMLIGVGGCTLLRGPAVQPTNFYVLSSVSQPGEVAPGRRLTLGLGPLTLPQYLERPEMVTRVEANQLTFDEFNRWGEPLKDNFMRVLASDLDKLVGFQRVIFYPWYDTTPMDYAVSFTVLRFETQPGGDAVLNARWAIGDGHGHVFVTRDSHFSRPAGPPAQTAEALSTLVGDLARDVASALRELDATRAQ